MNNAANQLCRSTDALTRFNLISTGPATAISDDSEQWRLHGEPRRFCSRPRHRRLSYLYSSAYDRTRNFLYVLE